MRTATEIREFVNFCIERVSPREQVTIIVLKQILKFIDGEPKLKKVFEYQTGQWKDENIKFTEKVSETADQKKM